MRNTRQGKVKREKGERKKDSRETYLEIIHCGIKIKNGGKKKEKFFEKKM